jgi:hypothetical protein
VSAPEDRGAHRLHQGHPFRSAGEILREMPVSDIRETKKQRRDMPDKKMVTTNTTRFVMLRELRTGKDLNGLVTAGIISINISNWLDVYEHYLKECEDNQKPIARQFTVDRWRISERNLFRIIAFMECEFQKKQPSLV